MLRTIISRGPMECGARSLSSRSFIILGVTCPLLGFRFLLLVPWVRLGIDPADLWKKRLHRGPPDSRIMCFWLSLQTQLWAPSCVRCWGLR